MWPSAALIKVMAEKRADAFNELLDEAADRLDAQLKFMRRQQASLSVIDNANKAATCLVSFEAGSWIEPPLSALNLSLESELTELAAAFWQELADEAAARGLECISLKEIAASWADKTHDYTIPFSVTVGIFCITVDFAADSVQFSVGGVPIAKPCPLTPSAVIENLCKAELELKEKQTVPRLALMRLVTAASVLSSERTDFTLAELWPIVHSIGLVASNFGRHPSKANVSCYTKAQFMYDTVWAFQDARQKGTEGGVVLWEDCPESVSLCSKVKIMRNGASNGK